MSESRNLNRYLPQKKKNDLQVSHVCTALPLTWQLISQPT